MSNLEIKHANKVLILQYLQKGFSITTGKLIIIPNTDPSIRRMIREDKEGSYEEYNGVVFHRNMIDGTQRMCLVLPEYIGQLVLKEFHTVKMMHLSAKQMARLFMFTFFTKNITRHCQEIADVVYMVDASIRKLRPRAARMRAEPHVACDYGVCGCFAHRYA